MKIKVVVLGLLLAAAAPAFAADVDGNWVGVLKAPDGAEVTIKYSFKADGATLTGTVTGPDGGLTAIKSGKVAGSDIAFAVDIDLGGQVISLNYTGVLADDGLRLHFEFAGAPIDLVAKRAP